MDYPRLQSNIPLQVKPTLLYAAVNSPCLFPAARCRLNGIWSLNLYHDSGELRLNGTRLPIRYGYASVLPPETDMEFRRQERCIDFCAHFTFPEATEETVSIPAVQDLGEKAFAFRRDFEQVATGFAVNPCRAEVRLWDMLWRLVERDSGSVCPQSCRHPTVQQAIQRIELRLGEPICIAEFAEELEVSHGHLVRLFRAEFGATVVGYIQARRVLRAQHLLLHTTLPIKVIASAVGIGDVQLFNKTIHRFLGAPPRRLREQQGAAKADAAL